MVESSTLNWIKEVKEAAKIADVISRYTGGGSQGVIKCPFHADKTPSMSINTSRNMYYCFGCGAGGDPISFVQKMEGTSFIDTCKKLAGWYNIKITLTAVHDDRLACQKIILWAEANLAKNLPAMDYLLRRGLNQSTIRVFKLGWIGADWGRFLRENKIDQDLLDAMGISAGIGPLFQSRVIFPISMQGVFFGIGGRGLNKEIPKYLNTAFEKKKILFGLDQAKTLLKSKDNLALVEGYLDAMMCYQCGIPAVATLGTSVSEEQLQTCFEFAKNLTICMDSDSAGMMASNKIALKLLEILQVDQRVSFINFPANEDPASYLARNKALPFNRITLLQKLWERVEVEAEPEKRIKAYESVVVSIKTIQNKKLQYLYLSAAKDLWFKKATIVRSIANPRKIREMILLSSIAHFPELYDEVADYVMTMELEENLYDFREYMVNFYQTEAESKAEEVIESFGLYSMEKLCSLAPFIIDKAKRKNSWINLFVTYWADLYK